MNAPKVAIVGAGLAGLTAAYRLQQANVAVQLVEAATPPCGRVQVVKRNGYIFDTGADALTSGYVQYIGLLRDLGLVDRLSPIPSVIGTIKNGRVIYMDTSSRFSMALAPLLSWSAKLKLLSGMKKLAPMLAGVGVGVMHTVAERDDESLTAKEFCNRQFDNNQELMDYLFDPMARVINTVGSSETSVLDFLYGLSVADNASYVLRGGQATLVQELQKRVRVQYNTRAQSVERAGDRVVVSVEGADGMQQMEVDGCIIATRYAQARHLCPSLEDALADFGRNIKHQQLVKIQLGYRMRTRTNAFVVQSPFVEEDDLMMFFLDHNKCSDRAPEGCSLMCAYIDTNSSPRYMEKPDDELIQWARGKTEKYFPELVGHYDDVALVSRWPNMCPVSIPGAYRRSAALLRQLSKSDPIQLAGGDFFEKTSQEAAVVSGNHAAENLIKWLNR